MGQRRFTNSFREHASLSDGTHVLLRLVQPDDAGLLQAGFERLSHDSRYRRFHSVRFDLTDVELEYFTNVDGENHFALGAVDAATGEGLGVARFVRLAQEPAKAEAAITVIDAAQKKGLGRLLVARLAAAARERNIVAFRCRVLFSNDAARNLLAPLARGSARFVGDGAVELEVPLPDVEVPKAFSRASRQVLRR